MTWRFVTVGDLHLDALRSYWPDEHVALSMKHADQPARYAHKNGIRDLVFLGDIGDGVLDRTGTYRLSETAQKGFYAYLRYWTGKGLRIHIIPGNHDHSSHSSSTLDFLMDLVKHRQLKNVTIYSKHHVTEFNGEIGRAHV